MRGTSPFTHEDDAKTPIHPSDPKHFDALHYGDEVPPKHEIKPVVLGPGAFGSPDPRTLGHRMHPLEDRPASAPNLDPGFEEFQGRGATEVPNTEHLVVTEEGLNEMSKSDVFELATNAGLNPPSKATKSELIDLILGEGEEDNSDDDDDEDDD